MRKPTTLLRRNKALYPIFKERADLLGSGKYTKKGALYLNSLKRVFQSNPNPVNQSILNYKVDSSVRELSAFSKRTAAAAIKKARLGATKFRKSPIAQPLRNKVRTSKPSKALTLAIEAITSGFFGDGNRLPVASLLSNDSSSFRKGLESMPLTLQYFYFNYMRDVEYNLNSYHFFNFTNFRSYNWLITT